MTKKYYRTVCSTVFFVKRYTLQYWLSKSRGLFSFFDFVVRNYK